MELLMPTVGAYLLIVVGFGAAAQALFGATSYF
jgi:hypothetical protein